MSKVWGRWVAAAAWMLAGLATAQPMRSPGERMGPQRMMHEQLQTSSEEEALQRRQRMSPEERRQLRRDVHDAGRDLYREQMRERRREMRRN